MGGQTRCPSSGPTPVDQQHGDCCYRASNAERLGQPELRVGGLSFSQPPSLANVILASVVASYVDQERFNWLWVLDGAESDGPISLRTGSGRRLDDIARALGIGA